MASVWNPNGTPNISTGIPLNDVSVDNIAALRAINPVWFPRVFVAGYYKQGDGGGGLYYKDTSDTTSADNGGTIILVGGFRYKLSLIQSKVTAKQFGCKGDGVTDDTVGLQNLVNWITLQHQHGEINTGTYKITAPINFPQIWGWKLTGEIRIGVTIIQNTDNVPIFNLCFDNTSLMHSCQLSDICFNYTNPQPAANILANSIYFNKSPFECVFKNLTFNGGYYGISQIAGVVPPWGCTFDDLVMGGTVSGGMFNWSTGVNATPNNKFGRIFCDCNSAYGPIMSLRGVNFVIETLEFINANHGPQLLLFAAGAMVEIGTIKLENGTYTTAKDLISIATSSMVEIGNIDIYGNNLNLNPISGDLNLIKSGVGGNSIKLRVGTISCTQVTSISGNVFVINASDTWRIGTVAMIAGWQLLNNTSTATAELGLVEDYVDGSISQNLGDADHTATLGGPNVLNFETPFTAPRILNLSSDNNANNIHNGVWYDVRSYGAVNGLNTLAVVVNGVTKYTLAADKTRVRFMYRRSNTLQAGYIMTEFNTLP